MNQLQALFEQLRNLDRTIRAAGRSASASARLCCCSSSPPQAVTTSSSGRASARCCSSTGNGRPAAGIADHQGKRAANLEAYRVQLAEMEKSFGAMLRQLPNKTEVPNLLVDISQTASGGLEEKLFQRRARSRRTSTPSCRSASA